MTEMVVLRLAQEGDFGVPGKRCQVIFWDAREEEGCLSLPRLTEERLLELRQKHCQWAFTTGFANKLQEMLECGATPSMWWTSTIYERHPRVSPYLYPMYKLACLEQVLRELAPASLLVQGGSAKLQEIIRQLSIANGIPCRVAAGGLEKQPEVPLARRIYNAVPAPLRALGRFCWWLFRVKGKFRSKARLTKGATASATIVTYFPNIDADAAEQGIFRSRYWGKLHDALAAQSQAEHGPFVRWLFLHFPTAEYDLNRCIALRDQFQRKGAENSALSFNFLEEFLSFTDICNSLGRWFKLMAASWRQERWFASQCHLPNSCFNFWPLLRWDWGESMRGWRCLERCLHNAAFRSYCREAGAQRWNLYVLENCPWERMFTEAARTVPGNGPVYGAQHSTIRPTDFRYFDSPDTFTAPACAAFQPDLIAGNGSSAISQWRAAGMPQDRLYQIEALRYLYLNKSIAALKSSPALPVTRLLIATSFFRDEVAAHLELLRQCLLQGVLDNYELVLKPHPYLPPDAWLGNWPQDLANRLTISPKTIREELVPGTGVWASNSTSVALEAALCGLPVLVMVAENDFDLCPIQDVSGLARTGSVADVIQALNHLRPLVIAADYLDLNDVLPRWKRLLGLNQGEESVPRQDKDNSVEIL